MPDVLNVVSKPMTQKGKPKAFARAKGRSEPRSTLNPSVFFLWESLQDVPLQVILNMPFLNNPPGMRNAHETERKDVHRQTDLLQYSITKKSTPCNRAIMTRYNIK